MFSPEITQEITLKVSRKIIQSVDQETFLGFSPKAPLVITWRKFPRRNDLENVLKK